MEEIINRTEYNEENFWRGLLIFRRGVFIAMYCIYGIIAGASAVLAVYVMSRVGNSGEELQAAFNASVLPMIILAAVFVYSVVKLITLRHSMRKRFMNVRTRAFEVKRITFDGEGYSCNGDIEQRTVPYTYIEKIKETPSAFYILNGQGMDIVDKNGFEQGNEEALRALLKKHCPAALKSR